MKTPDEIARQVTDDYAIALSDVAEHYWPMIIDAIEADRAQRQPDPMHDPRGTAYVAPDGRVFRHAGFTTDWTDPDMRRQKPYLKVMTVDSYMSIEDDLPEGSAVVWRPEVTE